MTLTEMSLEIVARAGEGFNSYTARANALVRAALHLAISTNQIDLSELDGSIKFTNTVVVNPLPVDPLVKISFTPVQAATDVILFTKLDIPTIQDKVYFSKAANMETIYNAKHYALFTRGSASSSLRELLYYIEPPFIYLAWVGIPVSAQIFSYEVTQIKTDKQNFTIGTTEFNGMMNERVQQVIIDLAVKLLTDEINR